MKKSNFLWTLVALPFMASCSHDVDPNSGIEEPGMGKDGVYMTLLLNPAGTGGTRSQTVEPGNASNDGTEEGKDYENKVNDALIVITDMENNYIASSYVPGENNNNGTITTATVAGNPMYVTTAKFNKTDIGTYYTNYNGTTEDLGKVHVFVFCNPTSDLTNIIKQAADGTFQGNWYDCVYSAVDENGKAKTVDVIWNARENVGGFTMSNVTIAERDFPKNIDEWSNYSTALKPFDLSGINSPGTAGEVDNLTNRGPVKVHRMAARFDFRDGSQIEGEGYNGIKGEPFTYAVVKNVEGKNIVKCTFYSMALTNMSTTEYYLGRVSDNGRPAPYGNDYMLCGVETPFNYVVSTNAEDKFKLISSDFSDYFLYPFFNPQGLVFDRGEGWDWVQCSDVVKGENDEYVQNGYNKSFHIWRYVTENTIPGPADKQVNAQSTGVVFKARMLPTNNLNLNDKWEKELFEALTYANSSVGDGKLLHNNADTDPILYSLAGNTLYVSWLNVRAAALAAAGFDATKGQNQTLDRKASLFVLCFGEDGGVGTVTNDAGAVIYTDPTPEITTSANYLWQTWENLRVNDPAHTNVATQQARSNFKAKATELGFTLYQSSEDPATGNWGYYCYYYYWNRHNDNGNNGVMGPMEFAVVRNNVYKLTVRSLNTLGHPRIPENDPDTPTPDTPDESSEVYLTVSVEIVPWVVRLNPIDW